MSNNNLFEGKSITVFGGTGTIGSLIVEELLKHNPKVIRIFTNDEHSLVKAQHRWGMYKENLRYLLGDIRDMDRCLLATNKVDYVFNAAAIKHVPVCEYNPMEAVKVNILGLNNILQACVVRKISKVLHISTDKAVEPTTIMGMSKKIGEEIVQRTWFQNPEIQMVIVRLGNVWGSRGSLVPLIHKCVKEGKSITLTDTEMERFFMTPKETVDFILKAFIEGKDGEIWVPKLRETRIIDLIKKEAGPNYPIHIIGPTKGEKLREKLLTDDEVLRAKDTNREYWIISAEER